MAARLVGAAYWKKMSAPTDMEWYNNIWEMMVMHKLTAMVKLRTGQYQAQVQFQRTRFPFVDFCAKHKLGTNMSQILQL